MGALKSWTVSDALWERVEPLLPQRVRPKRKKYQRREGGGRKPLDPRTVFEAIIYVLRTGCQWKALPKVMGSGSSVHKYFQEWVKAGVFTQLWRRGLMVYDGMEGIAWSWQSIDCSMVKAPLALESAGPNPTDRGKKRDETQHHCRRAWNPVVRVRQRSKRPRFETIRHDHISDGDQTSEA